MEIFIGIIVGFAGALATLFAIAILTRGAAADDVQQKAFDIQKARDRFLQISGMTSLDAAQKIAMKALKEIDEGAA